MPRHFEKLQESELQDKYPEYKFTESWLDDYKTWHEKQGKGPLSDDQLRNMQSCRRVHIGDWEDMKSQNLAHYVDAFETIIKSLEKHEKATLWVQGVELGRTGVLLAVYKLKQGILDENISGNNFYTALNEIILDLRIRRHNLLVGSKEQYVSLAQYGFKLLVERQNPQWTVERKALLDARLVGESADE